MAETMESKVQHWVDTVTSCAGTIYVMTSNGMRSLEAMSDGDAARNQCWKVAKAVTALAVKIPDVGADFTGLSSSKGSHYATMIHWADTEIIVDFTASQYDPEAPFPLVADKRVWEHWVQRYLGQVQWVT